ncbi:hypothetical protein CCP1ISM_680002 [Azospirillaceae bacterium]
MYDSGNSNPDDELSRLHPLSCSRLSLKLLAFVLSRQLNNTTGQAKICTVDNWTNQMDNELIPIASLQERYNLSSRQAIYDRIAALKITPAARGKLSSGQVDKLDKLDKFLKSTPGAAIANFPKETEVIATEKIEISTPTIEKIDNFNETLNMIEAITKHFAAPRDPQAIYAKFDSIPY